MLDVFADARHQGNQLLVLVDEDGQLSHDRRLAITREVGFAETAFICSTPVAAPGQIDVRIYTPEYEVPFAGHPSLGLAHTARRLLQDGTADTSGDKLRLNVLGAELGRGQVAVSQTDDTVWWMEQPQPVFLTPFPLTLLVRLVRAAPEVVDVETLKFVQHVVDGKVPLVSRTPGEGAEEVDSTDVLVPEISTGLPYLLIPVRGADALATAADSLLCGDAEACDHLKSLGLDADGHPLCLTTSLYFYHFASPPSSSSTGAGSVAPDSSTSFVNEIHVRMFCFEQGKWVEDAATGSAAGCLCALLSTVSELSSSSRPPSWPTGTLLPAHIKQGHVAMGRPSTILVDGSAPQSLRSQSTDYDNAWVVRVGGRVQHLAEGKWGL